MTKKYIQHRLGELRILGPSRPLVDRNLRSLLPDHKDDIIGYGSHYERTSVSCTVKLSIMERWFLDVIEEHGPCDGEEIWNAYYGIANFQLGFSVFKTYVDKLHKLGLIDYTE